VPTSTTTSAIFRWPAPAAETWKTETPRPPALSIRQLETLLPWRWPSRTAERTVFSFFALHDWSVDNCSIRVIQSEARRLAARSRIQNPFSTPQPDRTVYHYSPGSPGSPTTPICKPHTLASMVHSHLDISPCSDPGWLFPLDILTPQLTVLQESLCSPRSSPSFQHVFL
jgi:hypothetical protein